MKKGGGYSTCRPPFLGLEQEQDRAGRALPVQAFLYRACCLLECPLCGWEQMLRGESVGQEKAAQHSAQGLMQTVVLSPPTFCLLYASVALGGLLPTISTSISVHLAVVIL